MALISAEELRQYRSGGFFVRPEVLTTAEVRELQIAAERSAMCAAKRSITGRTYSLDGKRFVDVDCATIQFEHGEDGDAIRVIEPADAFDDRWQSLIDDPRITQPIAGIIGTHALALWTIKLNLKRPAIGSGFGWHQDSPYWIHDCKHVDLLPNVYVALDDATQDNGCLRVIRASHTRGCLPGRVDGTQLGGFFTDATCFDEADQVALTVAAGSLVFFSPHIVHGSRPNTSDRQRRAVIITYQPAGHPTLKSRQMRNIA